jgi:hypothetical protein
VIAALSSSRPRSLSNRRNIEKLIVMKSSHSLSLTYPCATSSSVNLRIFSAAPSIPSSPVVCKASASFWKAMTTVLQYCDYD